MHADTIYFHGVASGFVEGEKYTSIGDLANFLPKAPKVLPESDLQQALEGYPSICTDCTDYLEDRRIKLGVTMILENYSGNIHSSLRRTDPFFRTTTETMSLAANVRHIPGTPILAMQIVFQGCKYPFSSETCPMNFAGPANIPEFYQKQQILSNYADLTMNSVTHVEMNLLMTPISTFISANKWAEHVYECGHNIIRTEVISECVFEHVFTKYSASLREDLKNRGPSDECDQSVIFDPLTLAKRIHADAIREKLASEGLTVTLSNSTWDQ